MEERSSQALQASSDGPQIVPSSSGALTVHQQAHGVTTNNGDIVLAGGSVNIQKHYHTYHVEPKLSIVSVLSLVRNLRKVHLDVLSKATPGTGVWLLKTKYFILWLDLNGDIKILWGTGIPGAGKSVIASIVINELEARAAAVGGSICVCYVYFRYSDGVDLTVRNVLETLVKQTIERHPECESLAEDVYARHLRENTQPTEVELLQLLQRFTGAKSATFYILDALDEAPDKLQLEVVKKLASLNVRLFVTSRPLKAVESRLSGVHSFPIVAQVQDIILHINQEIERSSDLQALLEKAGPLLKEELVSSITRNCDGMFLHASLQLDAVCECLTPREVKRTLEAFPANIEGVYLQTWNRILKRNPARVSPAKVMLVWVLNAARSMKLEELERAVATSPETFKFEADEVVSGMTLVTLCRGLVASEEESRVVRLVHYTAKRTLQVLLQESFPHPHSHLAAVCMAHLSGCGFQNAPALSKREFTKTRETDPLLAYASDAWSIHARESLEVEDTVRRIAKFVNESNALPVINTCLNRRKSFDILKPLHILAMYNLPICLMTHGNIGDPNIRTQIDQETPLMLASGYGHEGILVVLLARPEIQVNAVDRQGWSALIVAVKNGREGIVKLLLAHPEIHINLVNNEGKSALMPCQHEGIVTLLLAHPEAQVNLVGTGFISGYSALTLAAQHGYEGVVRLLLAHPEIDVNLVPHKDHPALAEAAFWGHEGIVRLLLARPEIQINLIGRYEYSALMLAARAGRQGIVMLLLAHSEIQVNLVPNDGWIALMHAAIYGHEGIVELLLARPEIQVNLVDNKGLSALMLAACEGHTNVVKLLLARPDIQVNLVDSEESSALIKAAGNGHESVVELFLAHPQVQVNPTEHNAWSALMLASQRGNNGVVRLLLARPDIQVNLINNNGWSALMLAACEGHESVVKLLVAQPDIQVNLVDSEQWSALMLAAHTGHASIVQLLLARSETQVNLVNEQGWSAVMLAAEMGHEPIIHLLLTVPHIDTMAMSIEGGHTALSIALANGHMGVVDLLQQFQSRREVEPEGGLRFETTVELGQPLLLEPVNGGAKDESGSEDSDSYDDAEEWLEAHDSQLI